MTYAVWTDIPLDGPPRTHPLVIRVVPSRSWGWRVWSMPPVIHAASVIDDGLSTVQVRTPLGGLDVTVCWQD